MCVRACVCVSVYIYVFDSYECACSVFLAPELTTMATIADGTYLVLFPQNNAGVNLTQWSG